MILIATAATDHNLRVDDPAQPGGPAYRHPRAKARAAARASVDIDVDPLRSAKTDPRRKVLVERFEDWLVSNTGISLSLLLTDGILLAHTLKAYGKVCFYRGGSAGDYGETINGICDRVRHWRPYFTPAWDIYGRWRDLEPSQRRMVMPAQCLRAATVVALFWGSDRFTGCLLLGFCARLYPSELLLASRSDLVLPCDYLSRYAVAFLKIVDPKARRYLRRQHAKVTDKLVVRFLSALHSRFAPQEPLFGASPAVFNRRWRAVFDFLGVPTTEQDRGITPGTLRGSGATFFFQWTDDISKTAWRGRWLRVRTLESYLQEVASHMLLASLAEPARTRILELDALAPAVLGSAILRLET